jgi:hypothetical protein
MGKWGYDPSMRLGEPQSWSGPCREQKNLLRLTGNLSLFTVLKNKEGPLKIEHKTHISMLLNI